jgi:L-2,4-diaminobutyric acid acetyltransferase
MTMTDNPRIVLRRPVLEDGKQVYDLIERCPPLDLNSSYCYFLLCSHFSDTCVVAEDNGRLVGFLSAYLIPDRADTLFVWQMAVDESARGQGLAGRMLDYLLAQPCCADVRSVETTVSPSNQSSRRVFIRLAERLQSGSHEEPFLEASHFGNEGHEEERLIRIGPWDAEQQQQEQQQ